MELLLNAVWLLVGIAAVGFWLVRARGAVHRGRGAATGLIVLCCVLALIFPVISMSDDLHAQQVAVEDSSITCKKMASATAATVLDHAPAATTLSCAQNPLWQVLGVVEVDNLAAMPFVTLLHISGRAPPFTF